MCIIIAKPAGVNVPMEYLENSWAANPHGAGVCFAQEGKLFISKGFMSLEEFTAFIGDTREWDDVPAIFHFRWATHGEKDKENTHPFEVIPGKLAFAHNGVMRGMRVDGREELSDTQVFNRYILKQLPHNFLRNEGIQRLITEAIDGDKLAFMDNLGNITIFNERLGHTDSAGVWYSNSAYKPAAAAYPTYSGWVYSPNTNPLTPASPWTSKYNQKPVVDPDETLLCEDWYCASCSLWFDEDEADYEVAWMMDNWDASAPICPFCGSPDAVVYDPLNDTKIDINKSNTIEFVDEEDGPSDTCALANMGS